MSSSFGSCFCRSLRLVSVNGFLFSVSRSFDNARPGGVKRSPSGFLDSNSCGFVSFDVGRGWSGFAGMNTRLEV